MGTYGSQLDFIGACFEMSGQPDWQTHPVKQLKMKVFFHVAMKVASPLQAVEPEPTEQENQFKECLDSGKVPAQSPADGAFRRANKPGTKVNKEYTEEAQRAKDAGENVVDAKNKYRLKWIRGKYDTMAKERRREEGFTRVDILHGEYKSFRKYWESQGMGDDGFWAALTACCKCIRTLGQRSDYKL